MAASPRRSYSSTVMRYTSGAASRVGGVFTLVFVGATVAMSGLLESDKPEVGKMSILHPDRQDSSKYITPARKSVRLSRLTSPECQAGKPDLREDLRCRGNNLWLAGRECGRQVLAV